MNIMIYMDIFIYPSVLSFLLVGIVSELTAFVLPKTLIDGSSTRFHYTHYVLQSVSSPALVNNPLLFDADLNGCLDIFGADLAGKIYGVLNFNCISKNCEVKQWHISVPHHSFPNSPIMIPMNRQGNSLVAFVSYQACIFAFDNLGKLSTLFQIPNLRVVLRSREEDFLQSTSGSTSSNVERIEWSFSDHNANSSDVMLRPHVFADAIHHTVPLYAAMDESALLDQPTLVIPVTFYNDRHHTDTRVIHVTAIVTVSRRALLLGNRKSNSHRHSSDVGLRIQVLEVTEQTAGAQYQPTRLVSSPVVVLTGSAQDLQTGAPTGSYRHSPQLSHSVLIATTTGHLHRVPLPLVGSSNPGYFWYLGGIPLPHSCLLLRCPKSTSLEVDSALCCILLDASNRLLLVEVPQAQPPSSRPHLVTQTAGRARIYWQYNTTVHHHYSVPGDEGDEPRAQVTLVPTCSSPGSNSSCLWAVFPSPDGSIHAVDVATGTSIPGYPLRLFHRDSARVTFAAGPGQLSVDASGAPWVIYSDSLGRLYHICLPQARVVSGIVCTHPSSFYSNVTCFEEIPPGTENSIRMSPLIVPTGKQIDLFAAALPQLSSSGPISLLLWNDRGLQLMLMSSNTVRVGKSANQHNSPLFPISWFDMSAHSASISGYTMAYRFYNCLHAGEHPTSNALVDHPLYIVRLLDAMGLPFSEWSASAAINCQSNDGIQESTNGMHHCGHLVINQLPAYGQTLSVNSAFPMVLRRDAGLVWASSSDTLNSVLPVRLIDTEVVQQQVTLLFLTYLPGVVLFFGLSALHVFSTDVFRRRNNGKPLLNSA